MASFRHDAGGVNFATFCSMVRVWSMYGRSWERKGGAWKCEEERPQEHDIVEEGFGVGCGMGRGGKDA